MLSEMGKPLEHWLQKLEAINCNEVIINKHYMVDMVTTYLSKENQQIWLSKVSMKTIYLVPCSLIKYTHMLKSETTQ